MRQRSPGENGRLGNQAWNIFSFLLLFLNTAQALINNPPLRLVLALNKEQKLEGARRAIERSYMYFTHQHPGATV
jgi:hypothetical protein